MLVIFQQYVLNLILYNKFEKSRMFPIKDFFLNWSYMLSYKEK